MNTHADRLVAAARRVLRAMDRAESNRGRFSCVEAHDCRCPKSRAARPEDWRGEWICECGSEELDTALAELSALVDGGR